MLHFLTLLLLIFGFLLTSPTLHTQTLSKREIKKIKSYENEMISLADSLLNSKKDTIRRKTAHQLVRTLVKSLKLPKSYLYNFDSLAKFISIIRAPDDSFRVFTWYWIRDNGTMRHYGCFQRNNTEKLELYPLFDNSDFMPDPECATTGISGWYGALYFQIIKKTSTRERTRYVLLGWDGNDFYSNKKVIDVVKFEPVKTTRSKEKDTLTLGGPFFEVYGELKNRVIFEYKKDASMSLHYQPKEDMIIFSHLSPPALEGFQPEDIFLFDGYMMLPDGTFDGLYFDDGNWRTKENINVGNTE